MENSMTLRNAYIYIVIFIGGASVLAVEILGTRILGPFYGVSLYLWSALITVTLAALSLGYILGGIMADTNASISRLSLILAVAGIWIIAIPWIKQPFLILAEPLGLRIAVLVAAGILFFPPLMLLGMISPIAIKLKVSSMEVVGRTAGNLYAVSTIASVAAALLTGFILIPNIGVGRLTMFIGMVLILTAGGSFFISRKPSSGILSLIFVVGGGVFGMNAVSYDKANPALGIVALEQSPYAEIRVVDADNKRYLLIDGGIHSIVDTSTWDSYHYYTAVTDIPRYYFEKPGSMLLIGLGGGSVVKKYAKEGWSVDAVEIDDVITDVAYRYFGLKSSEASVYHMDGRQFLLSNQKKYDVIVVDAFGSSAIPFHLVTTEAFQLIAEHLVPNGILAINVETVGWKDTLLSAIASTLKPHFREVLALPMAEPPDRLGNVIVLAANYPLEALYRDIERDYNDPDFRYGPKYYRVHAWDNRFTPSISEHLMLTDDLNPVDIWAEAVNNVARKELHEFFKQGISW